LVFHLNFNEDNVIIIYSPSARFMAGNSRKKQKPIFNLYNEAKHTQQSSIFLDKVLLDLGWTIKGTKKTQKI
jgi:hypothetical protein